METTTFKLIGAKGLDVDFHLKRLQDLCPQKLSATQGGEFTAKHGPHEGPDLRGRLEEYCQTNNLSFIKFETDAPDYGMMHLAQHLAPPDTRYWPAYHERRPRDY